MEDISRFDFVMTVANSEVPSEIINAPADYNTADSDRFTPEMCQSLILWAWSRTPEQIQFTPKATRRIIREAIKLGTEYSARIPLIQVENIRIKLAKISASVAARVFSTDEKYQQLIIDEVHVKCACNFLNMIYSKRSMSYDTFSNMATVASTITNIEEVEKAFKMLGDFRDSGITGVLELRPLTYESLADYVGDISISKDLIGRLVRLRCLYKREKWIGYDRNPAFTEWLRKNSVAHKKERDYYANIISKK